MTKIIYLSHEMFETQRADVLDTRKIERIVSMDSFLKDKGSPDENIVVKK